MLGGAERVGDGLDAGDGGDMLTIGGENDGAEAGDLNGVAGMDDAARLALDGLQIGGEIVAGDLRIFAIEAVVEEFAYGNALDQLRHAAHVVAMKVGNQQVVDAHDAGVAHGCLDAVGVASARPAGIDQQRCAGRSHQQRGLAAFHIDRVDEQMLRGIGLGKSALRLADEKQGECARGQQQKGKGAGEPGRNRAVRGIQAVVSGNSHLRRSLTYGAGLGKDKTHSDSDY